MNNGDQKQFVDFDGVKLKVFEDDDVAGVLAAVQAHERERTGGGQFDEKQAKEQLKKALAKQGVVEFTDEEMKTMPKIFKRLIVLQKKRCRLRKHVSGKDTTTYEIRFRRDGYDISASGKTIELAKANFIEKLKTAQPKEKRTGGGSTIPTTFTAFALYHYETFRKEKVSSEHYKNNLRLVDRYLSPRFKETPIEKITPPDCKKLLDEVMEQGKGKTADDLHSILNGIFKSAIAHGIIERNPLALILYTQHERESGKAITKDEETRLFNALNGTIYATAAALVLFCGLRPNELETAKIQGPFIVAVNSKRKTRKTEYKRIPIIDRLHPFLPADGVFNIPNLDMLRRHFKRALPGHKLYDLRTTFYTRCKEYDVADAARDHFVGHSFGVLGNTYTDLSDEYLLKEGKKLNAW